MVRDQYWVCVILELLWQLCFFFFFVLWVWFDFVIFVCLVNWLCVFFLLFAYLHCFCCCCFWSVCVLMWFSFFLFCILQEQSVSWKRAGFLFLVNFVDVILSGGISFFFFFVHHPTSLLFIKVAFRPCNDYVNFFSFLFFFPTRQFNGVDFCF